MISSTPRTVLINQFMKKLERVSDGWWMIHALGGQFGSISYDGGKYFAHYTGRDTPLKGHKYFMQAVAECMNGYIKYMQHYEAQFKHQPIFMQELGFTVVFGADRRMYVKHTSEIEYRAISHYDIYNFAYECRRNFPDHGEDATMLVDFTKKLFSNIREKELA